MVQHSAFGTMIPCCDLQSDLCFLFRLVRRFYQLCKHLSPRTLQGPRQVYMLSAANFSSVVALHAAYLRRFEGDRCRILVVTFCVLFGMIHGAMALELGSLGVNSLFWPSIFIQKVA